MRTIGAFLILISGAGLAEATPVSVSYDSIIPETLEDFENYPPGSSGEPISPVDGGGIIVLPPVVGPASGGSGRFTGFTVETNVAWAPTVWDGSPCPDKCLDVTVSPVYSPFVGTPVPPVVMTFHDFPEGTTSFGFELLGTMGPYAIHVQGATTSLALMSGPVGGRKRFGFQDSEGLVWVSFEGARYFDNVVTSSVAPIPLPPAGALILVGIAAMALLRLVRAALP